jgi:hypothetical protein
MARTHVKAIQVEIPYNKANRDAITAKLAEHDVALDKAVAEGGSPVLATADTAGAMPAGAYYKTAPTTVTAGSGVATILTVPIASESSLAITARIWASDNADRQCDCVLIGSFSRFVGDPIVRSYSKGSPYRLDVVDWAPSLAVVGNTIALLITADALNDLTVSAEVETNTRAVASGTVGLTDGVWVPQGTILEPATVDESTWLQEPNILYDTDPQILTGETNVFKIWYTHGLTASLTIGYAEATNPAHPVKHPSNPILTGYTRCGNVSRVGGYRYLSAVNAVLTLCFMRSADGVTGWTTLGQIPKGGASDWNSQQSNSCAYHETGDTWYMMWDGVDGVTGWYVVGGATSTDGGVTWVQWANPVINFPTSGPDINGSVSGPFFTKIGGKYYCWVQASPVGTYAPTDIVRFESTAPDSGWTQSFEPFSFERFRPANRSQTSGVYSQVADVTMTEANGKTYMVYSGLLDAAHDSHLELAVAPMPLSELVLTTEGISRASSPEMLINQSFEGIATTGYTTFFGWIDTAGDGAVARTVVTAEVHSDSSRIAALKLTAGALATTKTSQVVKGLLGGVYAVSGWARGDGTHNGGRIRVQDSNGTDLIRWPREVNRSTSYAPFLEQFIPPADGVVTVSCYCPSQSGGIAYIDDLSIRQMPGSALDAFTPTQYPHCVLRVRADGLMTLDGNSKASLWQDESGQGNDPLMATEADRPQFSVINRVPYLQFDGISQYMATAAGAVLGPHTLYCVGKAESIHARYDGIVGWGSGAATGASSWIGITDHWWYGNAGYGTPISAGLAVLRTPTVLAKTWDGTSSTGYRRGNLEGSVANGLTACDGVIVVGQQAIGGGSFAHVSLNEIIAYTGAHSAAQVAQISAYLSNYWRVLQAP